MNSRLPNLSPSVWPQEILVAQLNVSRDQCSRPYRPAARYAFLGKVHGVEQIMHLYGAAVSPFSVINGAPTNNDKIASTFRS